MQVFIGTPNGFCSAKKISLGGPANRYSKLSTVLQIADLMHGKRQLCLNISFVWMSSIFANQNRQSLLQRKWPKKLYVAGVIPSQIVLCSVHIRRSYNTKESRNAKRDDVDQATSRQGFWFSFIILALVLCLQCHEWSAFAAPSPPTCAGGVGSRGYFRMECWIGGVQMAALRLKFFLAPTRWYRTLGWTGCTYHFSRFRYGPTGNQTQHTNFSGMLSNLCTT